jgi:hypothetical protein
MLHDAAQEAGNSSRASAQHGNGTVANRCGSPCGWDTSASPRRRSILTRNLALKEDALKKASPLNASVGRFRPDDELPAFVRNV